MITTPRIRKRNDRINGIIICVSRTVVKNLPGGVVQPVAKLLPQMTAIANPQIVPNNAKSPPINNALHLCTSLLLFIQTGCNDTIYYRHN